MRNKSLFAAAVAFVLTLGGVALSAQDSMDIVAKMDVSLKDNLTTKATQTGKNFGYLKDGAGFYSLAEAMAAATTADGKASVQLGNFSDRDAIQFGYAAEDGSGFTPASVKVASDPGYSYTYNPESFYTLDFSNSAFDGNIEIFPLGTPLPASTVTLLVALAAAAALVLLNSRRKQVRASGQA